MADTVELLQVEYYQLKKHLNFSKRARRKI